MNISKGYDLPLSSDKLSSLKARRIRSPDGSCERPNKIAKTESASVSTEEKLRSEYRSNLLKKIKRVKHRHHESFLELCFLQEMGNMVDFQSWKRKPSTQAIQSLRENRLDSDDEPDNYSETMAIDEVWSQSQKIFYDFYLLNSILLDIFLGERLGFSCSESFSPAIASCN